MSADAPTLTKKDFQSDQEVRWCPGCGDYAILSAVQTVMPDLGIPKEDLVVIAGIGCSGRFPYYMDTFGFHTIHGRAPAIATGLKTTRPDLQVWVVTGDGDALSIGGNHLIHALRRNVDLKIVMFNNRIYGLTKGQYSPTSEVGKRTKSTPVGSIDNPFNPLSVALGAGATFVARSVDIFQPHLKATLKRMAEHDGSAFVEVYQNCNIFNDEAFAYMTAKENRKANTLFLEDGEPLVFGEEGARKGLRFRPGTFELEVLEIEDGDAADDCLVWDEDHPNPALAFLLAQAAPPELPTPIGVLRAVEAPTYDGAVIEQLQDQQERLGTGSLEELLYGGDTWSVETDGSVRR
ncbi:MAG: 2-oxoacid:ferredoxin oxidoreductase subunit beta [Thermoanaerobaculia bacterium]|nr:2-oxoacid:ferredoxin oxidoreductase subunit beta [Thermoanaerobaculia bacterium]